MNANINTNTNTNTNTTTATETSNTDRSKGSWFALAALASVLVLAHNAPIGTATATAAASNSTIASQEPPQTPFNATQQRREMIAQLDRIDRRLAQVESTLNKGIRVTVTEMPSITIKNVSDFKD